MTQLQSIRVLSEAEELALLREEVGRLNDKLRDCDERLSHYVHRMQSLDGWDYRDDERVCALKAERDGWLEIRDRQMHHLVRFETMFAVCKFIEVRLMSPDRREPFPNPEAALWRPKAW